MSLFETDKSADRIPVSVLTGFLGSGKTTLLNALLRDPALADTAVIVNEFGEIGLDHLLMESVDGEMTVMASGCICCTIRSDLESTLRDLLARARAGSIPQFRRVVVETTGLADPAPIVQMLLNNPLVSGFFRLDAVITTVDAVNGGGQLDTQDEALKQAAMADRLILTKTDLADSAATEALATRLASINPTAERIRAVSGAVAASRLFGAGWYDPDGKTPDVRRWLRDEALAVEHAHHHGDHDHHDVNRHDGGIVAFAMTYEEPLDWDLVNTWLAGLREIHGEKLLRVKGILNLADEPDPVVIHGVQHVFHSPARLPSWPDGDRRSRIVFITRDLDEGTVRAFWDQAAAAA
ncbi:MAG: GTP-binding protein [Alphaproteobacteria bacterium]|nr:GTP-binding protein [Alphaproteobacteria bacterium]